MPEIFNRRPLAFGGAFAADAANIFFGTVCLPDGAGGFVCGGNAIIPFSGIGLLTQNVNIQYSQPINRIFEVGGHFQYFVAGRPQGNMSLGRIVGPRPITTAFYTLFGDVCKGPNTSMLFAGAAGCSEIPILGVDEGNGFMFLVDGALLQSIGISVGAQDMIINEQLQFMFIALLVPDADGNF